MKPPYTDEEIEEMMLLMEETGFRVAVLEIIAFLKEQGHKDSSSLIINLRKEFMLQRLSKRMENRNLQFPNSTLQDKLLQRLDYEEANKTF